MPTQFKQAESDKAKDVKVTKKPIINKVKPEKSKTDKTNEKLNQTKTKES